jgi:hypothetical protein
MSFFTLAIVILTVFDNHLQAQGLWCYECSGSHFAFRPPNCSVWCMPSTCNDTCGTKRLGELFEQTISYGCYTEAQCSNTAEYMCCPTDLCNPTGVGVCPPIPPSNDSVTPSVPTTTSSTPGLGLNMFILLGMFSLFFLEFCWVDKLIWTVSCSFTSQQIGCALS